LLRHPEAVFGPEVEATVLDPDNPYVLAPHLCAAAAELPLTEADHDLFGPSTSALLDTLVARGALRRRPAGWYWTRSDRAADLVDLRGGGADQVQIVEADTGRLIGTVDAAAADATVHDGAVYLHQGDPWLVRAFERADRLALVEATSGEVTTQARQTVDIRVFTEREQVRWGQVGLHLGVVEVTSQVVSFRRRELRTGIVLGEEPLDLPPHTLRTVAVWWTVPESLLAGYAVGADGIPGAAHAAEHAAIGLLPLMASCDRWDVGGVSTALHPDTGLPTIFVYDGHPGGAGFAERGFRSAATWLRATRSLLADCPCRAGCPACVQSPKCGNGNEPLDKDAAGRLLDAVLVGAPADGPTTDRS
jgi:DEAD/DEAH box helicase domain-containing protein